MRKEHEGDENLAAASFDFDQLLERYGTDTIKRIIAEKFCIADGIPANQDLVNTSNQIDTEKEHAGIEKMFIPGGIMGFKVKVNIGPDGYVTEFTEDVDQEGFISYGEYNFRETLEPLISAGVECDYRPWESEDWEDYEGYIRIKKESLNNAIKNGSIAVHVDDDGDLELRKRS